MLLLKELDGRCHVLGYFDLLEMKSYNCIDKANTKIWNLKYTKVMYIWNFSWLMAKNIKNITYLNLTRVLYVIIIYMYTCVVYICILISSDSYIIRYGIYIHCLDIILKLHFWYTLMKENITILYTYFFMIVIVFHELKWKQQTKQNTITHKWKNPEKIKRNRN